MRLNDGPERAQGSNIIFIFIEQTEFPENTHHEGGGNYQCMADLLFDWFGFDQTSKTVLIHHKHSS